MSTITQLLCNKFGGIRERNSLFTEDLVTAQDMQNVELFYTGLNSGVGIRTAKGNRNVTKYTQDVALDVYTISGTTTTKVATDGYFDDEDLKFKISSVTHTAERSEDDDTEIEEETYYAFKENSDLYYVETLTPEQETLSIIPSNEDVIGMFQSVQAGNYYFLIYTESTTQGKIYNFNKEAKTITPIITGLSVTGKCCGADFAQGWRDYFVFSNGTDVKYIYSDSETLQYLQVESAENIHLIDEEDRTVKGLGIKNFDSRMWIFDGKVLWYSEQGDCRNFTPASTSVTTDPGYIEFAKDITAIYPYLGSLAVFHKDSSALVNVDSTTGFSVSEESPGGCASFDSLIFHGTELYFYDDTKKGVFSFQQVVNGDKTLGNNVAVDIQSILVGIDDVDEIRTLSVVNEDRNEIWFLIPTDETYTVTEDEEEVTKYASIVLIYDYLKGEWIKRKCQEINCLCVFQADIYSGGEEIYEEYVSETFDGDYIQRYYKFTPMNLGANNTLKVLAFPPRLTLMNGYNNQFYVKYVKNFNTLKKPKVRYIKSNLKNYFYWDVSNWDEAYWVNPNASVIKKLPSATFKTLEIELYSTKTTETFGVKNIEFSKIKVKQV